jgi:hypothetical protein
MKIKDKGQRSFICREEKRKAACSGPETGGPLDHVGNWVL